MNSKFVRATIVVVLVFLVALPVFSGGRGESPAAADASDDVRRLTFLVDNQSELSRLQSVFDAAEEQLGISVEIDLRPGGAEGDNIVRTRLATGDMADLSFYNSGSLFMALNPDRHFVDLSDQPFMANVDQSFKDTVSVNGRAYAVPAEPGMAGGWLYNKAAYDELGLSVPSTWDDLMDNLEVVKEAGRHPVIASFGDTWTSQLIFLADYYNVQGDYPTFAEEYTAGRVGFADVPAALRSFERLQEVHDRDLFSANPVATTFEDALHMLIAGEGVHYPMLSFALTTIESIDPAAIENIGFFPQPGDDPDDHGITLWSPAGIAVYRDGPNVDAALELLEFFVSPEGMDAFMQGGAPTGPLSILGVEMPDDVFPAVADMLSYIESGKTAPALEFLSPVKGPNLEHITVQVGIGLSTAREAAEEYDRDAARQARQLGLEGW